MYKKPKRRNAKKNKSVQVPQKKNRKKNKIIQITHEKKCKEKENKCK